MDLIGIINLIFQFFFQFSNYFISFALTCAVIIIFLRILEMIVLLIWNIIIGTSKRQDFSKIKNKWLGKANPKYRNYFILGIVLSLIGIILILTSSFSIEDTLLILEKIGYNLSINPLPSLGSLLLLFGMISLYFSLEDVIKGTILKTGYYESPYKIIKKHNLESFKKLKNNIIEVEEKTKEAVKLNIDTTEEQELIHSIPIERIKELIEKNDHGTARTIIEQSINRCQFSIGTIEKKIETANMIWKNWNKKLNDMLIIEGEIRKDMLIEIPRTWRAWALEKYLIENIDKNLIIENGVLKKIEIKKPKKKESFEILESLIKNNKEIENGAVFGKDGNMVASALDTDVNKSIISLMLMRMFKAIKIIETSTKTKETQYIIAKSGNKLFFMRPSKELVLLCITNSLINIEKFINITNESIYDLEEL